MRVFWDGLDKYGDQWELTDGEWTSLYVFNAAGNYTATALSFVAGQFGGATGGQALKVTVPGGGYFNLNRTLPANYGTLIVGVRFQSNLELNSSLYLMVFGDGVQDQLGIGIDTSGRVFAQLGPIGNTDPNSPYGINHGSQGAVIGTSTASVTANTWHYLEAQITFAGTGLGSVAVYLDNVTQALNLTALKTIQTANSYANTFRLFATSPLSGPGLLTFAVDDIKMFDTTGSSNNAIAGDQRVETLFATADSANASTIGAGVIGKWYSLYNGVTVHQGNFSNALPSPGAVVTRVVPGYSGNIASIGWMPMVDEPTARWLPIVYSDLDGSPNALLATGPEVDGISNGVATTGALTTPLAITAGTPYWVGFLINDGTINYQLADTTLDGIAGDPSSFAAPGTYPIYNSLVNGYPEGQAQTPQVWANIAASSITGRFNVINMPLPGDDLSYVVAQAVNAEDLWAFESLSSTPTSIAGVKVSALMKKDDGGNRTVNLEADSGGTKGAGDATGQQPAQSYAWVSSYFATDPNTGSAWTGPAVNAATYGQKIIT